MDVVILTFLAKTLLLPPNPFLILMTAGALASLRFAKAGRTLSVGSFVLLVVSSMPIAGEALTRELSDTKPFTANGAALENTAIVILGAETASALELGGRAVGRRTLERLRYGARLSRQLGLPILVTGGTLNPEHPAVGGLMAETLQDDFGVGARWQETKSRNTYENAAFSSHILHGAGIDRVILVTHALHMRRAQAAFADVGLAVMPAGVGIHDPEVDWTAEDFIPSAAGLASTAIACYELIGRMWYRLYYLRK